MQVVSTTPLQARRLLELDYDAHVPMSLLVRLERWARSIGLPMQQLELLGQDAKAAAGFINACAEGMEDEYLDTVSWGDLEAHLFGRPPVFN